MLRPLPQGLQRALFSLLLVPLGFSGLLLRRLLTGVVGLCTLCQGVPVAVLSAWFAGGVPLLPFPYLRVGVLLAKVCPEFVGWEAVSAALCGSSSFSCVCWSFTFFWSWGGFWSQVGGPSCDSWFWFLLMLGYTFLTP